MTEGRYSSRPDQKNFMKKFARTMRTLPRGEFGRTPKINKDAGRAYPTARQEVAHQPGGLDQGMDSARIRAGASRPIGRLDVAADHARLWGGPHATS